MTPTSLRSRLMRRKSIEMVLAAHTQTGMRRTLGPIQLMLFGIGCIVGAGIYVMTGVAAAHYAGPAVILSFILAATACAFTALCYAELASALPVAGSSYTYAYATLGEGYAWGLGWFLMLEYGLAGSALAVGAASFLASLMRDFGLVIPAAISTPFVQSVQEQGGTTFQISGGVNLVAAGFLLAFALILVRGITHSAVANGLLVVIKLLVLLGFIAVALPHVDPANWHPFIPPSEGGFRFGIAGIFRASSILFFAFLGFETVSTAALEARNPGRDIPIGIIGALAICTLLYIAVAAVMTGVVSYRALGVADPIAVAVDAIGWPVMAILIKVGALCGLSSVLLVNTYGHSRICYAMAQDGLLPRMFGLLHARFSTPHLGTIGVATISALAAAMLPIGLLGDLVSIGTALAFSMVAISVIWLRNRHPELHRPFRVPFGGFRLAGIWIGIVPLLALVLCIVTAAPVFLDMILKAAEGEWLPLAFLSIYLLLGALFYLGNGRQRESTNP